MPRRTTRPTHRSFTHQTTALADQPTKLVRQFVETIMVFRGLDYHSNGQELNKGILTQKYIASVDQGIWEFLGTPDTDGGFSLINIVFSEPK